MEPLVLPLHPDPHLLFLSLQTALQPVLHSAILCGDSLCSPTWLCSSHHLWAWFCLWSWHRGPVLNDQLSQGGRGDAWGHGCCVYWNLASSSVSLCMQGPCRDRERQKRGISGTLLVLAPTFHIHPPVGSDPQWVVQAVYTLGFQWWGLWGWS